MSAIYECECDSFEMYEEQDSFEMAEAVPGPGVPSGGSTGQVLKKRSDADYDTEWADESGGGGGTSDYTQLSNKPQINGNTLIGNKSGADLGLVNAETGKGLSTNDYTTADKNKLFGIEAQANKTVIDSTLTNAGQAADAKKTGDEISGVKNTLSHKADIIYDTASGSIASFPDGANGLPVKDLTVAIEPVQDLHGYDNPWPAGGGANICDEVFESGTINSSGNNSSDNTRIRTKNYIPCQPNTSYFYKGPNTIGLRYYDGSKVHLGSSYNEAIQLNTVFTTPAGAYYLRFSVSNTTSYGNDIAINYPSSITTYSPYSNICPISGRTGCSVSHSGADTSDPTVIPISWQSEAGTVYGGMLDVTSGVLTVDRAIVDVGELSIAGFVPETHIATYTIDDRAYGTGISLDSISNTYDFYGYGTVSGLSNNLSNAQYGFQTSSRAVRIRDDRFSTSEDFAAAMSGVKIVYYLAAPLVIPLDPVTVETLLGQNNVWSDTGAVLNCEYPADTKLYVSNKMEEIENLRKTIAPIEDGDTASQLYGQGRYFFRNGNFCKAKTDILQNAQFTLNTNYEVTTVANELYDAINPFSV